MAQPRIDNLTEETYLQYERASTVKHEFYAGQIYALAGASERHNLIAINLAAMLRSHLRGRNCRTYPSDMRLKVLSTGLMTYPDFTIVCGSSLFLDPEKRDTLLNPSVILEILSPSTESYDRGVKFQHYRTIESLQEYILIAQDRPAIERYTRQQHHEWLLSDIVGIDAVLAIAAVQADIPLTEIYDQVVFDGEDSQLRSV